MLQLFLRNNSKYSLERQNLQHTYGTSHLEDPRSIAPGKAYVIATCSHGIFTGAEGNTYYKSNDGYYFDLEWFAPYNGQTRVNAECRAVVHSDF